MNTFQTLNKDNLVDYAMKNYYNPRGVSVEEFNSDYKRFKYIKRLINKYNDTGVVSERRLVNHVIITGNVFGINPTVNIMKVSMSDAHWEVLKPVLVKLNFITANHMTHISEDEYIKQLVRNL